MSDNTSIIEALSGSPLWSGLIKRLEALERRFTALEAKLGIAVVAKKVDDEPCPECGSRVLLRDIRPHVHLERLGGQERVYPLRQRGLPLRAPQAGDALTPDLVAGRLVSAQGLEPWTR